jgi:ZIP Zinc transporter
VQFESCALHLSQTTSAASTASHRKTKRAKFWTANSSQLEFWYRCLALLQLSALSGQHMPHQHTLSAEMPVAMSSGAASMDPITIFKITAASLLFIVAAVAGMLPLLVRRGKLTPRRQAAASTLTCAASGVLIASGLCHMLPESSEELVSCALIHHTSYDLHYQSAPLASLRLTGSTVTARFVLFAALCALNATYTSVHSDK